MRPTPPAHALLPLFALLAVIAGSGCRTTTDTYDQMTQVGLPDVGATPSATPSQATLGALLRYGDQGWGIMPDMDGHLVVLGGRAYQLRADGRVYTPTHDIKPRFATLSQFLMDVAVALPGGCDLKGLQDRIRETVGSDEVFLALRITGRFERIEVSAPRPLEQESAGRPPKPEQRSWTLSKVSGTMVGFRHPASVDGLHPPGVHLVFISHDLLSGGYVRDFKLVDGDVEIDVCSRYLLVDPQAQRVQRRLMQP